MQLVSIHGMGHWLYSQTSRLGRTLEGCSACVTSEGFWEAFDARAGRAFVILKRRTKVLGLRTCAIFDFAPD